jgi:hypothetical protein
VKLLQDTLSDVLVTGLCLAIAARLLLGCGGAPFAAGELAAPFALDAGQDLEGASAPRDPVLEDGGGRRPYTAQDAAGADSHDAPPSREAAAGDVASPVDAGGAVDEVLVDAAAERADAGDVYVSTSVPEAAPPPPALCCMTPCSGSQVAAIACGQGPAWTCGDPSGPSCSASRCAPSSLCYWQGATCAGRVAVCP